MSFATLDDLRAQLGGTGPTHSPEYLAKMMHPLPPATVVDRVVFLLEHCKGKRVLEFGASGAMHDGIVKVATECMGVDRQDGLGVVGFDLDDVLQTKLPDFPMPEIVICGEVIEHLSNPGWFLTRLKRQYPVPTILTVPNAYAEAGRKWILKGIENVNNDHVAWYSPQTLGVMLKRAGYVAGGLYWYNGTGPTAEGLIIVTE